MLTKLERVPISRVNLLLCVALALGILLTTALGLWAQVVMLSLMLVAGLIGVFAAQSPQATDVQRVNALEYRDERDRTIGRDGLAVVGAVALVLSLVAYMAALALHPEIRWLALGQFLALCVAWGIGNYVAARRH